MWKIYDELIDAVPEDLRVSECCVGLGWTTLINKTLPRLLELSRNSKVPVKTCVPLLMKV